MKAEISFHQQQNVQEEEEIRVGPPPGDDQARPPEDPHPQDQGWQQEVQGAQVRSNVVTLLVYLLFK